MKKTLLILLLFISINSLYADNIREEFFNSHPELKNNSTAGTDFYFLIPPAFTDDVGNNDKVYIYVLSSFNTTVHLDIPNKNYKNSKLISPTKPAIFELTPEQAQVYIKSGESPEISAKYIENGAIHLYADSPISASIAIDYRNSSEGCILYPTNILGNKYVISSYNDGVEKYPLYDSFPSVSVITAIEDNTIISFTFKGTGGTVAGVGFGQETFMPLNKGDVWAVSSQGENGDLSGSIIKSNKSFSVISGSQNSNVPVNKDWNNYLIEQDLAQKYWGKEYHLFKIRGRKFPPVIRIYTTNEQDTDTTIIYVHASGTIDSLIISKETAQYNSNFIERRFNNDDITLTSDKPFFITLYNTGVEEDGLPEPPGSPFQMNLMPTSTYGFHSTFFVDEMIFNQSMSKYYLLLIVKENGSGKISDKFTIGRKLDDKVFTSKISDAYILENKVFANGEYRKILIELTEPGYFAINSDDEFISYLYGFSEKKIFAYPAFVTLKNNNTEDTQVPFVEYKSNCPDEFIGTVCDKPDDETVRSNLSSIVFDNRENFDREIDKIDIGQTICANWKFSVKNNTKDAETLVFFRDYAGNDTIIKISYVAPRIKISPKYRHFGSLPAGKESIAFFVISNEGSSSFDLNKLNLKDKNSKFEIFPEETDIVLSEKETYEFSVKFSSNEEGTFSDSIGFGNSCYFRYMAKVEASVGEPIIDASDINFGSIVIGKELTKTAFITNKGISNLELYDIELPQNSAYSITIDEFTPNNPLILAPSERYPYTVKCKVTEKIDLFDKIIFHSNAKHMDSITYLNAKAMTIGLSAESYNFGRKRINRKDFPIMPYSIENKNKGLLLKNIGDKLITIKEIKILESENGEAFNINYNELRNMRINADEEIIIDNIFFNPTSAGKHKLVVAYIIADIENNEENTVISTLTGIGTVPKIDIKAVEFGNILQGEIPRSKQFIIKNLSLSNWKWGDTLNIYDITSEIANEISFDKVKYGSKGFMVDKKNLRLPSKIAQGQSYIATVNVLPKEPGQRTAMMTIFSDADNQDNTSLSITANIISDALKFKGGSAITCINNKTIISGKIINNTKQNIEFEPLQYINKDSDFEIEDSKFFNDFLIKSGDSIEVQVIFNPIKESKKTMTIKLIDKLNMFAQTADFEGKTNLVRRKLSLSPVMKKINPSEKFTLSVLLEEGADIDSFNVFSMTLRIKYIPELMIPVIDKISLNKESKGKFRYTIIENDNISEFEIELTSILNEPINKSLKIFDIPFISFLPSYLLKSGIVDLEAETNDSDCIKFECDEAEIRFDEICNGARRDIIIGLGNTNIESINPNPLYEKMDIKYNLSFNSYITIDLFNSIGEKVISLENKQMKAGKYERSYDISEIAAGLYYIILFDGTNRIYQTVIIN